MIHKAFVLRMNHDCLFETFDIMEWHNGKMVVSLQPKSNTEKNE
jgi:hypothetical protein